MVVAGCVNTNTATAPLQTVALGQAINESQLSAADLVVFASGEGLPAGQGSAAQGKAVFAARCQACHGAGGEGSSASTRIVGGSLEANPPVRTVGSYWPYATTLFDYTRRAMPANAPKSLSDTEVYQVVAYVLYLNNIVDENFVVDKNSLPNIEMPNRNGFIDSSQVR